MEEGFDIKKFIDNLAKDSVDEELTRHPEYVSKREELIQQKKEHIEQKIEEKNSKTYDELQRAGAILVNWIKTLPTEEKEEVTKQILKINQKVLEDDQIVHRFVSGDFNLQKLLQVDDSLMQQIYTIAIAAQDEGKHLDAAALLKFLLILNPYVADFWIGLGFSFMHLHELEEAQTYFDTAITMDTLNPRGYYFASVCSKMRKDTHKAANFCELGISLGSSEWADAFINLKQSL